MNSTAVRALVMGIALGAAAATAQAGVVVYERDAKKIEIGGRIQLQYLRVDPDCPVGPCFLNTSLDTSDGEAVDEVFFRRLRPYLAGSFAEGWMGKIEFDFGESVDSDEVQVKDAYFAYSGWKDGKLGITLGNAKHAFSREFLTSSAKLQLVERGFPGDHNFGSPDRVLGVVLGGRSGGEKISFAVGLGQENHDPDVNRMDFDSPANRQGDWNEGYIVSGRVDFHPLGHLKYDQADLAGGKSRFTIGAGAFFWSNDDDNNTLTDMGGNTTSLTKVDLDEAKGVEVSGGYRGHGWSLDVEAQRVTGDTVDGSFTGGLYENGSTDLDKIGINAGYMVIPGKLEIVAGWDTLDATNYAERFERATIGLNYYLHKHNLKFLLDYRMTKNFLGFPGQDQDVILAMAQFAF